MSQLPLTAQPTLTGGVAAGLTCVSGRVTLFRFIQAPPPGAVIGQITTVGQGQIPLVQTQPLLGGIPLSSVDGQFATVCGTLVRAGGQVALDVRVVNPGAPSPTGTPGQPLDLRLLLLLLLGGGGLGQFGKGGLLSGVSAAGLQHLNVGLQGLTGLLGLPGAQRLL